MLSRLVSRVCHVLVLVLALALDIGWSFGGTGSVWLSCRSPIFRRIDKIIEEFLISRSKIIDYETPLLKVAEGGWCIGKSRASVISKEVVVVINTSQFIPATIFFVCSPSYSNSTVVFSREGAQGTCSGTVWLADLSRRLV